LLWVVEGATGLVASGRHRSIKNSKLYLLYAAVYAMLTG